MMDARLDRLVAFVVAMSLSVTLARLAAQTNAEGLLEQQSFEPPQGKTRRLLLPVLKTEDIEAIPNNETSTAPRRKRKARINMDSFIIPPLPPPSRPLEFTGRRPKVSVASNLTDLRPFDGEYYTIRINTWKRPFQLALSVNHYLACEGVAQIQVVWCDSESEPPQILQDHPRVVIERHSVNSLNERFNLLSPAPTLGILSMDDDVLRPCQSLDAGICCFAKYQ